eukprot:PITA_20292
MSFYGLRLEYALEGSSNYIAWKDRMEAVLKYNELKEFVDHDIPKPPTSDAKDLAKSVAKARRIILGVRDHIFSNLHGKETPFAMWKALTDLFQNSSDHRKLALKDKLRKIKMEKGDSILKYLTKFTQCRDELGSVGITIAEDDPVSLALLGLPKSRHNYQDSVNGREKLLEWEQLWSDSRVRQRKGRGSHPIPDQILVKAVRRTCRKSNAFTVTSWDTLPQSVRSRRLVRSPQEERQRESGSPLTLRDIMYVPGLKNLVFVAMLEDRGYDVIFSKGKAFLRHIATGQVKSIGVRVKKLYKLEVEDCATLSTKANKVQSRYIDELWHKRLGHLHHGALKVMHQISTGLPKGTLEQVDTCKGSTLGKYTKASFHNKDSRAQANLDRVHSDVCRPFSTASTAKHRYYVIFVNDFSSKCWILFMQKKDQTFAKFCEFKALVEKDIGKKV